MTRPSDTKTDDTVAAAVEEFRTNIAGELLDLVYETEPDSIRATIIADWISRLNAGHGDALYKLAEYMNAPADEHCGQNTCPCGAVYK